MVDTKIRFGFFPGKNDTSICYSAYELNNPVGTVVFLHGKSESFIKYDKFAKKLVANGYSVYMMDHRGMGFSEREVSEPEKVYVRTFSDYESDLLHFLEMIVLPTARGPFFLGGHSMGGAVSAGFLEKNRSIFSGAFLLSPMLSIHTSGVPLRLVTFIAKTGIFLGMERKFLPGHGKRGELQFDKSVLTHDTELFEMWERLNHDFPSIRSAGVSFRWLYEAICYMKTTIDEAGKICVPVLLLQAGEDRVVSKWGQERFAERVPEITTFQFRESFHEILMEKEGIRERAEKMIVEFLKDI